MYAKSLSLVMNEDFISQYSHQQLTGKTRIWRLFSLHVECTICTLCAKGYADDAMGDGKKPLGFVISTWRSKEEKKNNGKKSLSILRTYA